MTSIARKFEVVEGGLEGCLVPAIEGAKQLPKQLPNVDRGGRNR